MFVCLFVGPPYCNQRAVFASPLSAFSLFLVLTYLLAGWELSRVKVEPPSYYISSLFLIQCIVHLQRFTPLFTSAKKVMFSLRSFVCLSALAGLYKNHWTDFHKIPWKGGIYGPRRNPLDFGGNFDHVTLGLGVGLSFGFGFGFGWRYTPHPARLCYGRWGHGRRNVSKSGTAQTRTEPRNGGRDLGGVSSHFPTS